MFVIKERLYAHPVYFIISFTEIHDVFGFFSPFCPVFPCFPSKIIKPQRLYLQSGNMKQGEQNLGGSEDKQEFETLA